MSDTNCHSELFGPDTNKRGEKLDEFIFEYGLKVENIGMIPTFENARSASCIDATLTMGNIGVREWRVSQDFNGSDHRMITFCIDTNTEPRKSIRNWEKTN